jgi:GNAT superfamily N-acetyltransferase
MLNLRIACVADAPVIVDFQTAMALESENIALHRETLKKGVDAVLDGRVAAEYWIAELEGQPVGMLMTVPEWSDWRNGVVLWIHSVYVVATARRQKVFSALYAQLRSRVMNSSDLVGLRLYVDKTNESAQRVYESLGMAREHYHLYEWLKDA